MTDNEKSPATAMSDDEIIKALECCGTDMNCHRCPANENECGCIRKTCQNALDLINRLQTDKEALIAGQETLQKALAEKAAEVERLKNDCFCISNERDAIGDCLNEAVEEAKAEAIKEFASAYKDQIKNYTGMFTDEGFYVSHEAVLSAVDFVLNRMAGDTE